MSLDTKHDDLQSLRIDRSHRSDSDGEPPKWAKRYILGGIAVVVLLGLIALVYRLVSPSAAEVEVVRAATEGGGDVRSEEHTSELQSRFDLVCRLLLEKKKKCTKDEQNE